MAPSPELAVPAAIVVLLSAVVQSATGFGFSIVAVPFLAALLGVREGIVVNLALSMVANAAMTARVRDRAVASVVRPMAFGAAFGLVPGIVVFYSIDVRVLKVGIALLVMVGALGLLLGVTFQTTPRRTLSVTTGVLSGFLGGTVGVAGPPLTAYLAGLGLGKVSYRATMSVYFTVLNTVLVPAHVIISGSLNAVVWTVLLLPAVPLGGWLGHRLFGLVDEVWFARAVAVVVFAAGVSGLLMGGI